MAIKCVLVNIDNVLISELEEVMSEQGEPDCRLINPYLFNSLDDMKPWLEASNQTEYMLRSEDILTIAEPTEEVIEKYKELTT
tara:strand:+ start:349 stop:597 length:249 start_codon:yes stop_codon:yes gene_type:complete